MEHDLSVLDYLSDYVCCLYGCELSVFFTIPLIAFSSVPGVYGVVTMPFSVREGINIFLDGFVPTENLRFRQVSLSFKVTFISPHCFNPFQFNTIVNAGERGG